MHESSVIPRICPDWITSTLIIPLKTFCLRRFKKKEGFDLVCAQAGEYIWNSHHKHDEFVEPFVCTQRYLFGCGTRYGRRLIHMQRTRLFNVSNGDVFKWKHLWKVVSQSNLEWNVKGMRKGKTLSLQEFDEGLKSSLG
ncbi:hypothetical protein Salat_0130300 [Sesamum alatum]|uniref:Uncharacterized protein n=1 Tax=Sesamum alatum TaxID=300844 RepID=A0AAE1YXM2_9LAMI|nr:hypothetical protein Salat_0130300 [Sesamum alatum]